jgi:hypothetical protein
MLTITIHDDNQNQVSAAIEILAGLFGAECGADMQFSPTIDALPLIEEVPPEGLGFLFSNYPILLVYDAEGDGQQEIDFTDDTVIALPDESVPPMSEDELFNLMALRLSLYGECDEQTTIIGCVDYHLIEMWMDEAVAIGRMTYPGNDPNAADAEDYFTDDYPMFVMANDYLNAACDRSAELIG